MSRPCGDSMRCALVSRCWVEPGWALRLRDGSLQQEEEGCLREQCRGLDAAVVRLTKFVRQNQMSLSHILLMEQKARCVSSDHRELWARVGHPISHLTTEAQLSNQ